MFCYVLRPDVYESAIFETCFSYESKINTMTLLFLIITAIVADHDVTHLVYIQHVGCQNRNSFAQYAEGFSWRKDVVENVTRYVELYVQNTHENLDSKLSDIHYCTA